MGQYLKLFDTHENYADFVESGEMLRPNVSHCIQENEVHYNPFIRDYSKDYLTIKALSDGTLGFHPRDINSFEYSLDGGQTWNTAAEAEAGPFFEVTLSRGDEVCFKKEPSRASSQRLYGNFYSTCQFEVYGNILSMVYGTGFVGATTISSALLGGIFTDCTGLVNAKNLVLAATTLADGCYASMFNGCTSLTTAPELPATTLTNWCYSFMFAGCTSLTIAPELPATTLAGNCYRGMFDGCTNLTTAPELPATMLTNECYYYMFHGCTSLTVAPELPATTLAGSCYNSMFYGCTSLTIEAQVPSSVIPIASNYCHYMYCSCPIRKISGDYSEEAYDCYQVSPTE
jgi:hypothetical protein